MKSKVKLRVWRCSVLVFVACELQESWLAPRRILPPSCIIWVAHLVHRVLIGCASCASCASCAQCAFGDDCVRQSSQVTISQISTLISQLAQPASIRSIRFNSQCEFHITRLISQYCPRFVIAFDHRAGVLKFWKLEKCLNHDGRQRMFHSFVQLFTVLALSEGLSLDSLSPSISFSLAPSLASHRRLSQNIRIIRNSFLDDFHVNFHNFHCLALSS